MPGELRRYRPTARVSFLDETDPLARKGTWGEILAGVRHRSSSGCHVKTCQLLTSAGHASRSSSNHACLIAGRDCKVACSRREERHEAHTRGDDVRIDCGGLRSDATA